MADHNAAIQSALRDLVEAIRRGEEVNTSHWAWQRAEALLQPE